MTFGKKVNAVEKAQSAWRTAAKELGFEFVAPFEIRDGDEAVRFHGYVRNFGGPKGAVFIVCETFQEKVGPALLVAKKNGYFHSMISAEVYRAFDREVFIEVLRDWGWFGAEANCPTWCA